jgi:mono/diheme cytochrome c family protein
MKRTKSKVIGLVAGIAALVAGGCSSKGERVPWALRAITHDYAFSGPKGPDGCGTAVTVSAADLNLGRQSYVHYCYACHGMDGDGKGPASHGYRPPPRDFRIAAFKFGAVRAGELPNDDDFVRILKGGLHGTAMLAWDIPDVELARILQFIKTFPQPPCDPKQKGEETCKKELAEHPDGAPSRWTDTAKAGKCKGQPKPTGAPIPITADPWAGKDAEALAKGAEIYHLKAQCVNCHPAYLTRQEMSDLALRVEGKAKSSFRENLYGSITLLGKDNPYLVNVTPPDFTLNPLRSIRGGADELGDLYRLIAAGVGGIMPAWIDGLSQEELWALAHYVKSLYALQGSQSREALHKLRDKMATQPAFVPPVEEKKEEPPAGEGEKPAEAGTAGESAPAPNAGEPPK